MKTPRESPEQHEPVHLTVRRTAAAFPGRTAVEGPRRRMTYRELDNRAGSIAALLSAGGAVRGARIAILAADPLAVIPAVLAVLEAGGIFVPLDPEIPERRLASLIAEVAPDRFLVEPRHRPLLAALAPGRTEVLELGGTLPAAAERPAVEHGPDDPCYVVFTSGSTGRPKGIVGRLKAIDHFIRWETSLLGIGAEGAETRVSQLTSPAFDAFLRDVFVPLCTGGTVCVPPDRASRLDPDRLTEWLDDAGIELLHCVPSLFRTLLAGQLRPGLFPALRWVLLAGEPLLPVDVRRWMEVFGDRVELINLYGPSETTMTKLFHRVQREDLERATLPIGRPMNGARALVVDEAGQACPPGVVGEIYIRTPFRSLGYLGAPELTEEAFVPNPFGTDPEDRVYKTGDLGRVREDGVLEFHGRRDHQVKIRGVRVEPAEIESALRSHPRVRDAAVVAREDGAGTVTLCGYAAVDRGVTAEELRQLLSGLLPEVMVPAFLVVLETLPRTLSGKVDRAALPEPDLTLPAGQRTAPRTPTEELLAALWEQVLGISGVGAEDDFFALGGHSLLALQVLARVRESFGVEVTAAELLERPVLSVVAGRIDAAMRAGRGLSAPPLVAVPRSGELPLSFAQQRLWFLDRLDPGQPAYNIPLALGLTGALDARALAAALGRIRARHEVLRTVFPSPQGWPLQAIEPAFAFPLPAIDLTALPAAALAAEAERLRSAEALAPFDLAAGPLVRARLLGLAADEHVLLLTAHHIVIDNWSLGVLVNELAALYRAAATGTPARLPELPVQYADYAVWQREWLRGEVLETQLAWWRERLADPPVLDLLTDRPRPPIQTFRGAREAALFPAPLLRALEALGRRYGVTLFMTVLAGVAALLNRASGQDDLTLGTPVAGRSRTELEPLAGCFLNTLVLRLDLTGDPGFPALAARVRQVCLGAFSHQDLPFDRLVEDLEPRRDLSRQPLFQAMLVLQNTAMPPLDLPGLRVRRLEGEVRKAHFDLTFGMVAHEAGLVTVLDYSVDLFAAATARRLLGQLRTLLASLAADPDRPLSQRPLLTPEERHQLLGEWNGAPLDLPPGITLHGLFRQQVLRAPDGVALVWEGTATTYGALDRRAGEVARRLRRQGVGPDRVVGLCAERSPEMIAGMLGILKAGAAWLPLDPGLPGERLSWMLRDSGAAAVVVERQRLAALPPDIPLPRLVLDGPAGGGAAEAPADRDGGASAGSLAYLLYTSGSTGEPKGVMVPHGGIGATLLWRQREFALGAGDRMLQNIPFTFDPSVWQIFGALLWGARLVLVPSGLHQDTAWLRRTLREQEISVTDVPPSFLQVLLEERVLDATPALRCLFIGGEAFPPELCDRAVVALGARVWNVYGPTEACVDTAFWPCRPEPGRHRVPIGRPIDGKRVYLLDRGLALVPAGQAGELYAGGPGLARGYLGRADLTAERFVPDPFAVLPGERLYRTGDLARHRADGALEFLGRTDRQVKLRGRRIELGEIEARLGRHPGVAEAAVVVREDLPGGPRLVGYCTPRGTTLDTAELAAHLRRSLPEPMVPADFVVLAAFPLTPNGKLDRAALPAPLAPAGRAAAQVPPRTRLERLLAGIWQEVLGLDALGVDDNFFDLGGHSLLMIRAHGRIVEALGREIPIVDLFTHPRIRSLARHLADPEAAAGPAAAAERPARSGRPPAIAVIGMAGRFARAADLEQLWANLRDGVEGIAFFSDAELAAAGAPAPRPPGFVNAHGALSGVELFDAAFFDLTPREAELLDPQKRLFLETAWEALEDAGHDPARPPGPIGVFGGVSSCTYLFTNVLANPETVATAGFDQIALGSEKDFLTTLVSYKLDLKGPSLDVQTACSTSLVAVHLACQSLLAGECDLALAGGVSVKVPQARGYVYQKGGINSPDGHCRAFDARAQGTVSGSGVGLVVLRRLDDALADGDRIRAVLLGSAMNNDGSGKVGYSAPSVEGQARVIAGALAAAGVEPETVSYVEAHGTGTPLGDPIEVAALERAFRRRGARPPACALGSIKTNLGHLDAAAGVAGLIKTVLALEHRQIPPSLHFERPNPQIDFAAGPFHVNAALADWTAEGPRRAGVSSFGIGGTNVHVVLEEAPALAPPAPTCGWQLLLLSARSPEALERASSALAAHLTAHPEAELADVAWTLQAGRHRFAHRSTLLCRDREEASEILAGRDSRRLWEGAAERSGRPVTFLFPGLGEPVLGMAGGLYAAVPEFRAELDRCFAVAERLGLDLRPTLLADRGDAAAEPAGGPDLRRLLGRDGDAAEAEPPARTVLAQPALFALEHALARLLIRRGVEPESLLGYSLGEYVAACVAGVFSLEDGLRIVVERARMIEELPEGAMLAVPLGEAEVAPWLTGGLGLSAVNGPAVSVVAGPPVAVDALEAALAERGLPARRLRVAHAFHAAAMEPLRGRLARLLAGVRLQPPAIPYLSNVTGTWVRPEEAVDPAFWARHLCQTVRFADGLSELLSEPARLFVEVGPGTALATALLQHPAGSDRIAVPLQPAAWERLPAEAALLAGLARLWLAGVESDWAALHPERRRRLPLPTYPFERQRYWIDPAPAAARGPAAVLADSKSPDMADWFWAPAWRESVLPPAAAPEGGVWLLFVDSQGVGEALAARLGERGEVTTVVAGERFARLGPGRYTVDPARANDYLELLGELAGRGALPTRIVHLWSLGGESRGEAVEQAREAQTRGFLSLFLLAQALAAKGGTSPVELTAVADGLCDVTGSEALHPEKATLLGPCLVIPRELAGVSCRLVDLELPRQGEDDLAVTALLQELAVPPAARRVAWRGRRRWVEEFQAVRIESPAEAVPRLHPGGVYLITGGTGGIGLALAERLAEAGGRPVLLGRSELPPRAEWDGWLATHGAAEPMCRRIERLCALERRAGEVPVLAADVADRAALGAALRAVRESLGPIRGVLHAAGTAAGGLMALRTEADLLRTLAPKLDGTLLLAELLRGEPLDFFVLFSSLSAILGGVGQADYCAANAFLDAFAQGAARDGLPVVSVAWDTWREVGMAVEADLPDELRRQREHHLRHGIEPAEGVEAFRRALTWPRPRLAVATRPLPALVEWAHRQGEAAAELAARTPPPPLHPRPGLRQAYAAPRNDIEAGLAAIWQEVLGLSSVGIHDPFPELGGHSLLAMRVTARVQAQFGVHLPLRALFEAPTIAELAVALVAETAREAGGEGDLEGLVAQLEALSDDEAAALLSARQAHAEEGTL